jgi:hypothetical protein
MNAAAQAELNAGLPARRDASAVREARRWIVRQLEWERTLDTLRGRRRTRSLTHRAA